MIDIFDNVLEEHNAILIDDEVKKISWKEVFIRSLYSPVFYFQGC